MASTSLASSHVAWTSKQNKQFEDALVCYDKDTPERWHNIAKLVGGKSAEEMQRHYEMLVRDIMQIETDQVSIPNYQITTTNNTKRYVNEQR